MVFNQDRGHPGEGSLVDSIFGSILLLLDSSMCVSAVNQNNQQYNSSSVGVSLTMFSFAVIGVL